MASQLRSVRCALGALYGAVVVNSIAGLFGGLFSTFAPAFVQPSMLLLSCVGVALLIAAGLILLRDVLRSDV